MDYLTFVDDISKIWTSKTNSVLSSKYSLNRSVLPALIELHKCWQIAFDGVIKDCDSFEIELNKYKLNNELVLNVENEDKIVHLNKIIFTLKENSYDLEKEIRDLKHKVIELENNSLFKKVFG